MRVPPAITAARRTVSSLDPGRPRFMRAAMVAPTGRRSTSPPRPSPISGSLFLEGRCAGGWVHQSELYAQPLPESRHTLTTHPCAGALGPRRTQSPTPSHEVARAPTPVPGRLAMHRQSWSTRTLAPADSALVCILATPSLTNARGPALGVWADTPDSPVLGAHSPRVRQPPGVP
ncbi:hypothetical protein HNY73_011605 [Argiope bruennichi]|uniref:Uncharacterized protein n=1 Tax=Argiope bruennichi TaxID=94029 RepID=A0A8T0EZ73_ARGBR|nr:hypothetical protein HNY73_011605 [Argiope bruennichi]